MTQFSEWQGTVKLILSLIRWHFTKASHSFLQSALVFLLDGRLLYPVGRTLDEPSLTEGIFKTECFGWTVLIYSCASEIYSQGGVTLSLCLQHVINLPRWSSPCQVRHRMDLLLNLRLITSFNNDSLSRSLESVQTEPPIKSQNTNGLNPLYMHESLGLKCTHQTMYTTLEWVCSFIIHKTNQ